MAPAADRTRTKGEAAGKDPGDSHARTEPKATVLRIGPSQTCRPALTVAAGPSVGIFGENAAHRWSAPALASSAAMPVTATTANVISVPRILMSNTPPRLWPGRLTGAAASPVPAPHTRGPATVVGGG